MAPLIECVAHAHTTQTANGTILLLLSRIVRCCCCYYHSIGRQQNWQTSLYTIINSKPLLAKSRCTRVKIMTVLSFQWHSFYRLSSLCLINMSFIDNGNIYIRIYLSLFLRLSVYLCKNDLFLVIAAASCCCYNNGSASAFWFVFHTFFWCMKNIKWQNEPCAIINFVRFIR